MAGKKKMVTAKKAAAGDVKAAQPGTAAKKAAVKGGKVAGPRGGRVAY